MPGFTEPLWLAGLILVPLIRWLHKRRAPLSSWPVSAIFLWQAQASDSAPGPALRNPDPAWRRRALAVALLVGALAGPFLRNEGVQLTVWVDDSLSMQARENGSTRLESALAALARDGEVTQYAALQLRSLSDPARTQSYAAASAIDIAAWVAAAPGEPDGPAPALMPAAGAHWLLSDGASDGVQSWAARSNLERVLEVGAATENLAIVHLAARRSLDHPGQLDVLVSVHNAGLTSDRRQVELHTGGDLRERTELAIPPGESRHWQTRIAFSGQMLVARLTPGDVLSADDELALSLERFASLAVTVSADCGPALERAIDVHPALQLAAGDAPPGLAISCARARLPAAGNAGAQVRALIAPVTPVGSTAVWTGIALPYANLRLASQWLAAVPWPVPVDAERDGVLVDAAGSPLVVVQSLAGRSPHGSDGPRIVDTVLDLRHAAFVREPEYAAFIGVLAELAVGRSLLDPTAVAAREREPSMIVPRRLNAGGGGARLLRDTTRQPVSRWLLLLAAGLLLFDTILFLRSLWRVRHG